NKNPFGPERFLSWLWLELSAVTIPANASAMIADVKSFDSRYLAASGHLKPSAGVSALPKGKRDAMAKNKITDRIKELEAKLAALSVERNEIMDKADDAGETLDAEQAERYDALGVEMKSVSAHLTRQREREKEQLAQAVVVEESQERNIVKGGVQFSG